MRKHTLLIMDDDPAWLVFIAKFFTTSKKYNVHTAVTCAEVLKSAELHKPDCILLDFLMSDGNGGKVCASLRSNEKTKKIPVIMVSAYAEEEANSYFEYKADGFIRKGAKLINIRGIVESVLRRVRWERGIIEKGDTRVEPDGFRVFSRSKPVAELSPDQFRLFSLLFEKSPAFVSEDEISRRVFASSFAPGKADAIKMLSYRLRQKLGPRLARRIKNKRDLGWVYLQPRLRQTDDNV
jgi:DNA-binding response OmpR family regulator